MIFPIVLCALFAWLCLGPFTIEANRAICSMNDMLNKEQDLVSVDKAYSTHALNDGDGRSR